MRWAWVVLGAFGGTALAAPLVRSYLVRSGTLDLPQHRSSHVRPTPRGGGLACLVGVLAGAVAAVVAGAGRGLWPVLSMAVVLAALGWVDDRRGLSSRTRLVAQLAAGLIAGVAGAAALGLDSRLALAVGVVGLAGYPLVVNTVNFMDGVNGITALTVMAWALVVFLGAQREAVAGQVDSLGDVAVIGGATAMAFLPWNYPKARMFLGDVGSYLFGGLLAGGLMISLPVGALPLVIAPLVPYLSDVLSTLARRYRRGAPLTEAHREHTYQRLVHERGWTHTTVSLVAAGAALVAGMPWALGLVPVVAGAISVGVAALYLALPGMASQRSPR